MYKFKMGFKHSTKLQTLKFDEMVWKRLDNSFIVAVYIFLVEENQYKILHAHPKMQK